MNGPYFAWFLLASFSATLLRAGSSPTVFIHSSIASGVVRNFRNFTDASCLAPGRLGGDAVHPVRREVRLDALVRRQLGHAVVEPLLVVERAQAERAVDGHARLARAERGDAVGQESDLSHLLLGEKIDVPLRGGNARVGVVRDRLLVGRIGHAAELADQHLAQPVMILAAHVDREPVLQEIAIGVALGQLLRVIDELVQRCRRPVRGRVRLP